MYYHITSLTNDIIASNLPPELWSEANRCVNVSVSELCPIKNKKKRHGVILSDEIRLYVRMMRILQIKYLNGIKKQPLFLELN